MPRNFYSPWLENIAYPVDGVGDLDDLRHTVTLGDGGKWISTINPGWYYFNKTEQYRYVTKQTTTVVSTTTSGRVVASVSFRPTWGPVLLTSSPSGIQYVQHHNCFAPAQRMSWTSTTSSQYFASVPVFSNLLGVRDLTVQPLGSVATRQNLISEKYYFYDPDTRYVYITTTKAASDITVYFDLINYNPSLEMKEIVVPENGRIRLSYPEAYAVSLFHGSTSGYLVGPVSGTFVNPLTSVSNGDWICASYYIKNSFCLNSHDSLDYFIYPGGTDTMTLDNESSIPGVFPPILITSSPVTGVLNFNPLLPKAFRTGYLFHSDTTSSYSQLWTPDSANTEFVSDFDEYCPAWGDCVKATLFIRDANNVPIPYHPFTMAMNNASTTILLSNPGSTFVDGRGEAHFLFSNSNVSIPDVYVSVVVAGTTYTLRVSGFSPGDWIPRDRFVAGRANLVVTNEQNPNGRLKTYVSANHLDGIPKTGANVTVKAKRSSIFETPNIITGAVDTSVGGLVIHTVMAANNLAAISSEIGLKPESADQLYSSTPYQGMSNLVISKETDA